MRSNGAPAPGGGAGHEDRACRRSSMIATSSLRSIRIPSARSRPTARRR